MTEIKKVVKNERELREKLRFDYDAFFSRVSQTLVAKASRYKLEQALRTIALILALGPGVVWFLYVVTYINRSGFDLYILLLIGSFVTILAVLIEMIKRFSNSFARDLDAMLYEYIFAVLEIKDAQHRKYTTDTEIRKQIRRSGLSEEKIKSILLDDQIYFPSQYSKKPNLITEVKIQYNHHSLISPLKVVDWLFRPAKQVSINAIFQGYFLVVQLPKKMPSRVFISSQQQIHKYGSDGISHRLLATLDQEWKSQWTELEWIDFQRLFAVAGSNEREIREVMTPDLMIDLYEWAKKHDQVAQLVFDEQYLYCLLPYQRTYVNDVGAILDKEDLFQYVINIATPLWFLLCLSEDIEHKRW